MTDTAPPLIYHALANVMKGCNGVAKRDRNDQQRFTFRGIDAVLNAVGPILREHSVMVMPVVREVSRETITTEKGKSMLRVNVLVDYQFYATDGSSVTATVAAESFDFGDKATAKAMSVAFRTALIQALALPTDETDPDAQSYDVSDGIAHQGRRRQQTPTPSPAPSPMFVAKTAVAEAWVKHHNATVFDPAVAGEEFAALYGGAVLGDATLDQLNTYATYLTEGSS